MKPPLRVAIIGAGFGQQVHAPVFQSRSDCEVVAICASNQTKAEEIAEKLSIPRAYGDWLDLIEKSKPDLLAVATPPALQSQIILEAFARGTPLLCEKPLTCNLGQAAEILKASGESNVPAIVDFEFPEIPAWRKCHALIQAGEIGQLKDIGVEWSVQTFMNKKRLESWKTRTSEGGGALYAFSSHILNYLEWFGGKAEELSAVISRNSDDPRDTDTLNSIELRYVNGCVATVNLNTDNPNKTLHRIVFNGTSGSLILENTTPDYILGFKLRGKTGIIATPQFTGQTIGSDGRILAVGSLANRLVEWIKTGSPARPDIRSAYRVQQLVQAALDSGGARISI